MLHLALATALVQGFTPPAEPAPISVATYNLWVGGQNAFPDKAASRQLTLDALRALDADILAIQEQKGFAEEYAAALGYHVLVQDDSTAVLTRFEIVEPSKNKWGAQLRTPHGQTLWVFNVHFPAAPYQPYQLESIPYHDARFISTPAEALTESRLARGENAHRALKDMAPALADPAALIILCGDFNEPSCLDWTHAATSAWGRVGPIDWPTTRLFHDAGFIDAFRAVHPDPIAKPGWTWTPRPDARDVMDRIDLVLVRPPAPTPTPSPAPDAQPPLAPHHAPAPATPSWSVSAAEVVGEPGPMTDRPIDPWPSDHRAVRVTLTPTLTPSSPRPPLAR
ncbi:MAG: endonuclease/exonuclease/phosphatase family protein [Phycisphaeraceae bacterium]|nr:MAG: endonuclease/exonuclease/phosphatase family protein [Phycisphaeraceae bacterium]